MSTQDDSLQYANPRQYPDRVFYELGVMLDQNDFIDEQNYHRGRLARALSFLHGTGTAAGLLVQVPEPSEGTPSTPSTVENEQVVVGAGLAIDGIGRLIEVPSKYSIRLKRWLDAQNTDDNSDHLRSAYHSTVDGGVIVVDVMIRFRVRERGKTPAFATGAFDALDAVQPSRLRDGFELKLVPRIENPLPVPQSPWPDLSEVKKQDRSSRLHKAILAVCDDALPQAPTKDTMVPAWLDSDGSEHWLFLARLKIPANAAVSNDTLPTRKTDLRVVVDNEIRSFVYMPSALSRLTGL